MTNRADFVVEEGGTLVAPAAFTTDYVVSVPSGTLTLSGLNITARLVKTGPGTLELAGYNALGGGVVVSNGTLAANYETSGLADTHVHLAGPSTTAYCYLGIHGDSFTAPIAESGAGTFSFGPYTGIKAMDPGPFTLNIGGDGHTIAWPASGDWLFGPNGGPFTVKNPLSANGMSNFTIKNTGTSWPIVLEGGITNNSTTAGVLNYWTGPVTLPARAGGARHEAYRFYLRSGDILFTNAIDGHGGDDRRRQLCGAQPALRGPQRQRQDGKARDHQQRGGDDERVLHAERLAGDRLRLADGE